MIFFPAPAGPAVPLLNDLKKEKNKYNNNKKNY
jgi:hypothetical protein